MTSHLCVHVCRRCHTFSGNSSSIWLPIKLKHSGLFHPPFMVMKAELGLGVWDCSLASTATLLPPLWPNNGINLAFASHAQHQPFHFTCAAASPFHSTYSVAPPVLFPCVCGVEGHSWFVLCWSGRVRGLLVSSCSKGPVRQGDHPLPGEPQPCRAASPSFCTNWQGLTLSYLVRRSRAPASEG